MTIKTPEQIADTIAWRRWRDTNKLQDAVFDAMVRAIKADRAQLREVKAQAWREGWDASERFGYLDGVLETPLNPYLEADDDAEPTSDDERDYGKYLDQQFWGDH